MSPVADRAAVPAPAVEPEQNGGEEETDQETEDGQDAQAGNSPTLKSRQTEDQEQKQEQEEGGKAAPPKFPWPKLRFPARIWNEVAIEAELVRAEQAAAATVVAALELDGQEAAVVAEDSKPKRQRRIEPVKEVGESSRAGARLGATRASRASRSSRVGPAEVGGPSSKAAPRASQPLAPPTRDPYARQYRTRSRKQSPVPRVPVAALPVTVKEIGGAKTKAKAKAQSAPPPSSSPSSPGLPRDPDGVRTAWRILFPQLDCDVTGYDGRPEAWRELMLYDKDVVGKWRARRQDGSEPYVPQYLGGPAVVRAWHVKTYGPQSEMAREFNERAVGSRETFTVPELPST
ncbi:hypothetical protein G6011_02892 [Alternaria panax]|uniref:Uncharacterized protein n=1 Tax=Alternaria panax TaxID=48097 RepID=A0AAD4FB33_9PLEO|nr:hypothetical protein G6011_02892 [Alternaria panax]